MLALHAGHAQASASVLCCCVQPSADNACHNASHNALKCILLHCIVRGTSLCRSDIRQDPVFRAQFHTMCANVGVDPLASNKGMWAQLLGFGDFYYELGVQIVEACLATRAYNGGFMELGSLRNAVQVSNSTICKYCKLPGAFAQGQ